MCAKLWCVDIGSETDWIVAESAEAAVAFSRENSVLVDEDSDENDYNVAEVDGATRLRVWDDDDGSVVTKTAAEWVASSPCPSLVASTLY